MLNSLQDLSILNQWNHATFYTASKRKTLPVLSAKWDSVETKRQFHFLSDECSDDN